MSLDNGHSEGVAQQTGSNIAVFNPDGLFPLIRSNLVAHGHEATPEYQALMVGIDEWLKDLGGVDPERAEFIRTHRDEFEKKLHDYAMKELFGDGSVAGHRVRVVSEAGSEGVGGGKNKRTYDKVLRDMLAHQVLQNYIDGLDRQIAELERQADAISQYLAEGDFEVEENGNLKNEEMEEHLRDYERRTGKRVDRTDIDAVQAALLAQHAHILNDRDELVDLRDKAAELVHQTELTGRPPTQQELQALTLSEQHNAAARMADEIKAEAYENMGFRQDEQEKAMQLGGIAFGEGALGDGSSVPSAGQIPLDLGDLAEPNSSTSISHKAFGTAANDYEDQPRNGELSLSGLFSPAARAESPETDEPNVPVETETTPVVSGDKFDLG